MCTDCSCGTVDIQAAPQTSDESVVATYNVTGMTCGHCAGTVTGKLQQLDGVTSVDVDLATGAVTVHSDKPVEADKVHAAIEEAGYTLTPA
ncbi:heavy-metal-associated domain-containing protein [Kribbella swartbergensis]